ncbi:hypothetical protein A3840_08840 [Devosia elaeis]|uniref:Uncharacterized protein n=1 Tax=Devosia elaeis TaxID=1770058 RepID=A0A178HY24_9HYPH|nr:hypothetical protein A3840_08840 [Devosia elaeis]
MADDPELAADTFEGMGLNDVLSRLVRQAQEAKAMAAGIAVLIGEYQARRQRFERRNEAMRAIVLGLLQKSGQQRVQLPEATVSIGKGRDRVEIVDEAALPKWALRVVSSPDKAAIKERLDAGKKVAGAELVTGGETLTMRVA